MITEDQVEEWAAVLLLRMMWALGCIVVLLVATVVMVQVVRWLS
jgi:hypothetical protein